MAGRPRQYGSFCRLSWSDNSMSHHEPSWAVPSLNHSQSYDQCVFSYLRLITMEKRNAVISWWSVKQTSCLPISHFDLDFKQQDMLSDITLPCQLHFAKWHPCHWDFFMHVLKSLFHEYTSFIFPFPERLHGRRPGFNFAWSDWTLEAADTTGPFGLHLPSDLW